MYSNLNLNKFNISSIRKRLNFFLIFVVFLLIIFCNLDKIVLSNTFNIENLPHIFALKDDNFFLLVSDISFRFTLLIIPAITFTIIELFLNSDKNKSQFKKTSVGQAFYNNRDDLWYWIFLSALRSFLSAKFPFIILVLTLGLSSISNGLEQNFRQFYENIPLISSSELFAFVAVILGFILVDLVFYIKHYLAHKIPILWDLHEFHHSAPKMTILNISRKTLLIDPITNLFTIPISVFTALLFNEYLIKGYISPVLLFLFLGTMRYIYEQAGHSSYKIVYPKPISFLFMSPSLHWIHHSDNPKHYNKNLGEFLTIWDKIFKTYLDESHIDEIKSFGVKNTQYNKYHPLYSMSILPIVKITKRLKTLLFS